MATTESTTYSSLREKIAAESAEREARYEKFREAHRKALAAAAQAALDVIPAPMVVAQHTDQLDDSSPVKQSWYVSEGACGFGWVQTYPGNSSFAVWAKKFAGFRKAYHGGLQLWSRAADHQGRQTQSYERNVAWARGYAKKMTEELAEVAPKQKFYGSGRLD